MTLDEFWTLVERSTTGGVDDRAEWLVEQLAALRLDDIVDFEIHLTAQRRRVDTWLMWDAATRLLDGFCSDDSFFYFQPWLVGLGRETFDRVAADPDALADVPEVRDLAERPMPEWDEDEWPEWEALNDVAYEAYARVSGEEDGLDDALAALGLDRVVNPEPEDDPRDEDQRAASLPRLAALLA